MPELRELIASYKTVKWGLDLYKDSPRNVLGFWSDMTDDEEEAFDAEDGLVRQLDGSEWEVLRGSQGGQSALLPPQLLYSIDGERPEIAFTDLEIIDTSFHERALLLDLGPLKLKLAYLTHTSVQIYSREQWDNTIRNVAKQDRKFRIGLAIETRDFILAFVSLDQLFQPTWATTWDGLGVSLPYVYTDYTRWLENVACWVFHEVTHPSDRSIATALRNDKAVFNGIGAYTVTEVCTLAGIPIYEHVRAVAENPSRMARLCEAIWVYAHKSETELPELLRPAWHRGVMAPTDNQRLRYLRWLLLWGKPKVCVPARLAGLAGEHNASVQSLSASGRVWYRRDHEALLPDPFEPAYLQAAFDISKTKPIHLLHLILGDEWDSLKEKHQLPPAPNSDPLTCVYEKLYLLDSPTYLKADAYLDYFYSDLSSLSGRRTVVPHVYKSSKSIPMFSLIDHYPPFCLLDSKVKGGVNMRLTKLDPQPAMFKDMITENGVAYGPLEYAGNGKIAKFSAADKVLVVRGVNDANLTENEIKRQSLKLARRELVKEWDKKASKSKSKAVANAFDRLGHRALTKTEKQSLKRKAGKMAGARLVAPKAEEPLELPSKLKKWCLSADAKLALQCKENVV
ncbi:hypothetical protein BKA70DRAFT_1488984 [Coprinopsis sp. MPI-PUGE-AT-0042]|nr:hypothetical protein BKA70DRAFT_1488984 [Coprinopsis sp. MPI-PUGE-AT-0042]